MFKGYTSGNDRSTRRASTSNRGAAVQQWSVLREIHLDDRENEACEGK